MLKMISPELIEKIKQCDVISFDIFDTLLVRPFNNPKDVFRALGNIYGERDFAAKRIFAEQQAFRIFTNSSKEDVTFDEIYQNLDKKYHYLKNYEILFEKQILQIKEDVFEIYLYALSLNKKIIIASDMYLPENVISEILKEKGIKDFYKIYVSNTYGLTKRCGSLYKYIIEDLNILPQNMLHIGDNLYSDIEKPKKIGIKTYYCKSLRDSFYEDNKNKVFDKSNLCFGIAMGMRFLNKTSNEKHKNDYWYLFGYNYGGILIYSFIQEVIKIMHLRNIKNVFFIARDGYVLHKAFEMINTNKSIKSYYIYASRIIKNKYLNGKVVSPIYKNYINSFELSGDKIAIVDTCAQTYSAQTLLEYTCPEKDFLGIYLTCDLNYEFNYINLSNQPFPTKFPCLLIETLLTSPETPIEDIKNNKPIYREGDKEEIERINIYLKIMKGELEFLKNITNILKEKTINITIIELWEYFSTFWQNMNDEDKMFIGQIKQAIDDKQTEFIPILDNRSQKEIIFDKLRKNIKQMK